MGTSSQATTLISGKWLWQYSWSLLSVCQLEALLVLDPALVVLDISFLPDLDFLLLQTASQNSKLSRGNFVWSSWRKNVRLRRRPSVDWLALRKASVVR